MTDLQNGAITGGSIPSSSQASAVNGCIIGKMTDFIFRTDCCKNCDDLELIKFLFYNEIDDILSYDITASVLTQDEINNLEAFTGCLYPVTNIQPPASTGVFQGSGSGTVITGGTGGTVIIGVEVPNNYQYIGYTGDTKTYTYDITDLVYEGKIWISIDNNLEPVGIPIDANEFVAMLNNMGLGVFTLSGAILTVTGNHTYGEILPTSERSGSGTPPLVSLVTTSTGVLGDLAGLSYEHMWDTTTLGLIDPLASPQKQNLEALGFRSGFYPGGSQIRSVGYIPGDTIAVGVGRIGNGYNGTPLLLQWDGTPCGGGAYTPGAILDGLNCKNMQYSFFPSFIDRSVTTGSKIVLGYNLGHGNVDDFIDAVAYALSKGIIVSAVVVNLESYKSGLYDNDTLFPSGGADYVTLANAFDTAFHTAYPTIPTIMDAAPIDAGNSEATNWNTALSPVAGQEIRDYRREFTYMDPSGSSDYNDKLAVMNTALAVTLPTLFRQYQAHPSFTAKKLALMEAGIAHGPGALDWENTILSALYYPKFLKTIIEYNVSNNDYVQRMFFYRASLLDMEEANVLIDYDALKLCFNLFKYPNRKYVTLTTNVAGITGIATISGTNVVMLFINEGSNQMNLDSVIVDGVTYNITTCDTLFGASLSATAFTYQEGVSPAVVRPFSIVTAEATVVSSAPTPDVNVITSGATALPNLYGSSAFDLSVENSIVGNTALLNNIASCGFRFIGFGQGAPLQWINYVASGGDSYNFVLDDVQDLGQDPTVIVGGIAFTFNVATSTYDPIVFGREFYDEYRQMMVAVGRPKAVVAINIVKPLFDYAGILIDWSAIDLTLVIAQVDLAIAQANASGLDIIVFELGMELTQPTWAPLFANPGGAEHGEGVYTKLLMHTNGSSATSILQHIHNVYPTALISGDAVRWDEGASLYPNWNAAVAALPLIDCLRNYYQFYETVVDYASYRARIAQFPQFFGIITAGLYNGKRTWVSQVETKAGAPVKNKCAHCLGLAEFYITMHLQNIAHSNILAGVAHFNIKQLFQARGGYTPVLPFYYYQMLGDLFKDIDEYISVTFTGQAEANVIKIAVRQGTTIKIGVVNPTANTYTQNGFAIDDTLFTDYTVLQRYANNGDTMATTDVVVNETGVLTFRPYSFSIITRTPPAGITFSVNKIGLFAQFTNESGGSSWLWDFGDGSTSTLENPNHLYLTAGIYVVTLTVDGGDSGTQSITLIDGFQPLFGVSMNNVGTLTNDGDINGVRADIVATIGYKYQAYTVGSENHWIHWVSGTGYPTVTPVSPNVGMRTNLDEIFFFSQSTSGAYNLQGNYNATNVDFFTATINYAKLHNQPVVFIINVAHGTLAEAILYLDYMIAQNVAFTVIYGNEQSIGNTSNTPLTAQTSAEYLGKVTTFDDWISVHYPTTRRIIYAANNTTGSWNNGTVASFAVGRRIDQIIQYAWIGNLQGSPNSNLVIGDYFTAAIDVLRNTGANSIYAENMPRITGYATTFAGMKMHVGQYGVSLQRSGYVAQTMLHGLLAMNQIIEFMKFNAAHNGFIRSGTFLNEDEAAVAKVTSLDVGWTIDPAFTMTDGVDTYAKRVPGMVYDLMNDLANFDGTPFFIAVDRTGFPANFDIVAFKLSTRILVYIYNYDVQQTLFTISANSVVVTGNCNRKTVWADQLYGSIGFNPAHSHFAGNGSNPGLAKVNVQILDGVVSTSNIIIKNHSMTRLELTSINNATTLSVNLVAGP